ncbi:cryptochrome/photolyase family protein [Halorussus halophilus]|uniref:cryptochrome/photolyase family protein n=1 Tax=Halorussus halophilus TaxID=2650975 RepID=UPI001301776B|nr:deoxyribodipyrimidine photo-lyase [Halorussus halophilus]
MHLHWHRRDLRVADNRALAAGDDQILPVFVFDPEILRHGSPSRVAFMLDALEALRESYRELGGDLVVAHGDPREELPRLADKYDADAIYWNRDYSGIARQRDSEVRLSLDEAAVSRAAYHDELLHEPGTIRTNEGEHYSVYTYFWKKWRDRGKDDALDVPDAGRIAEVSGAVGKLPTLSELGFEEPDADVPPAGTDEARELLAEFCDDAVFRYEEDRDYPTRNATSRLSAHLKWGTIGIREVWEATESAMSKADGDPDDEESEAASVREFQSQLAWREFYAHVLSARPDVVSNNYKGYENPIEWRDDSEALQAWKDGETGYPIVDAGMRQLRQEAYMHNRLRMIVASFLTKDLMLDWRAGYDWFREKLADHDTGNDNGGWQWAASTGTDAQPYFRIFNPTTQGERYDEDAEYIRKFVPELESVPADEIHEWTELSDDRREELAPEYSAPIVDHSERREQAIEMFKKARGEED